MKMKDPLVSVIIPVYKTEPYLAACMDSVLSQDYPALEVILVDDGSPDNCPALCDGYGEKYPHVKVVHQTNRGLGLSRNSGMEVSSGKYVMFLDSDDCLDGPGAVRCLAERAEETCGDIVTGSFRRFHDHEISQVNHHHLREGSYTESVDFRFKGFYMYGHLAYNWGKLYRKSFLEENGLFCKAYPFTQDKAHNMACCACRPRYAFVDDSVYLYRVNEESVTFRYKKNFVPVWISIATDFREDLKKKGMEGAFEDLPAFHIFFGSFFLVKQELQFQKHGIRSSAKALKEYGKNPYVKKAMKDLAGRKHTKEIQARSWKILIPAAARLFSLHGYLLFAAGIRLLRNLNIDGKITNSRYSKDTENTNGKEKQS